jgi:hypothetical protein
MRTSRNAYFVDLTDPASRQSWAQTLGLSEEVLTRAALRARNRRSNGDDTIVQTVMAQPTPLRLKRLDLSPPAETSGPHVDKRALASVR